MERKSYPATDLSSPPANPAALAQQIERGLGLQREGRLREALDAFERCLDAAPGDEHAELHAGMCNFALERWARGVAHLRVAVAAQPSYAEAWANLAFGLRTLERLEEARHAARRALELKPRLADAWNVLGLVEQDGGNLREATTHFTRALDLDPSHAIAQMNLANCAQAAGRIAQSLAGYERALAMGADLADTHYNIGHLHHKSTGLMDEAIRHYRSAVEGRRGFALAHHSLANALLLTGNFAEGWREYRWRPPRLAYEAANDYAPVRAQALANARLAIVAEQGLGDTLFFLRFASILRLHGARLEFIGDARLHGMLERAAIFERLAERFGDGTQRGDIILAGDLPLLALECGATAPAAPLALAAQPARVEAARARLHALGPPPHVAIAWRAGERKTGPRETLHKEIAPERLAAALRGLNGTFVSVQREPRPGETDVLAGILGRAVHDLSEINRDLEDALALMTVVEEYVGVSSTNVHLRASAGAGARVMVPFPYEWRWMDHGASAWFPGSHVYRQAPDGDWGAALEALSRDLAAAPAHRQGI